MKLLYKLLLWVAIATTALPAAAYDFMTGGLCYNINADGNTVTVSAYGNNASGSLNIPSSVNYSGKNYKVTAIGNGAFLYSGSTFTGSLTIPNSVTSIGENAFYYCDGLTGSLTIPNSVTSIGKSAFGNCSGFTGSLTIPNSVTSIGEYAFNGCSGFKGSLTIPNSVTSIGSSAFSGCSGFTGSLTIPNSVTSIGMWAFANCSGFTSINNYIAHPTNVTLGSWAFQGMSTSTCTLYVPRGTVTEYSQADQWKKFTTILEGSWGNVFVTSVTVSPSTSTLTVGGTATLTATVAPSNATNKNVTWTTSNSSVATISTNGTTCTVTAKAAGTATITCTAQDGSGKKGTCTVTVTQPVTSVTVSPSTSTLTVGSTATLTATVAPSNATNKNVTWTSSNTSVATVSANGTSCTVTAKAAGTATITCTAQDGSGKKGTCTVTVNAAPSGDLPKLTAPDLTLNSECVGQVTALPLTLTMPTGSNFKMIQIELTYPDGLVPIADSNGNYGETGADIPLKNGAPVTEFQNNFEVANYWPTYKIIGSGKYVNSGFTPVSVNPCQLYTAYVAPSANYTSGDRDIKVAVKYIDSNDQEYTIGSWDEPVKLCTVHFEAQVACDVNGDGRVDVDDLGAVINLILERTNAYATTADVNSDGQVNVFDVNYIIDYILAQ